MLTCYPTVVYPRDHILEDSKDGNRAASGFKSCIAREQSVDRGTGLQVLQQAVCTAIRHLSVLVLGCDHARGR